MQAGHAAKSLSCSLELPAVSLGRITVHAVTEKQCVDFVAAELAAGRGGRIVTLNVHHWQLFEADSQYAALCQQASLRVADGMPLVWASRLRRTPLPQRVAGSNLIWSLSAAAAEHDLAVYLLGGDPGTAASTRSELQRRWPRLRVVGLSQPQRGWSQSQPQTQQILRDVVAAKPDLVFVGLGKPESDRLIVQLAEMLPRAWMVGVGISFSFVAGTVRRAPVWLQNLGLEWAHRMWQEPRRLSARYLKMVGPGWRLLRDATFARWSYGS